MCPLCGGIQSPSGEGRWASDTLGLDGSLGSGLKEPPRDWNVLYLEPGVVTKMEHYFLNSAFLSYILKKYVLHNKRVNPTI